MRSCKELCAAIIFAAVAIIMTTAAIQRRTPAWNSQRCFASLKGLYQAQNLYSQDFNGELPIFIDQNSKHRWRWWSDYILPYVQDSHCYYCPANPKASVQFDQDVDDELLPPVYDTKSLSYGMNYRLGATIAPDLPTPTATYRLDAVKTPAKVVFFGDSRTPWFRGTKWCWKTDYAPVHGGRFQIVNCDGSTHIADKDNFGLMQSFDGWKEDPSFWK